MSTSEPELGDHVHEHRRLLLPRAREAEPLAELLVAPSRGPPPRAAPRSRRQSATVLRAASPSSTSLRVSARSPRRSVSSGMTSSGGMLPRLTSGPNLRTNHACEAFVGASKMMSAGSIVVDDLVDQAGAHLAGRPVDAGGAALAALGDHLPGAGVELLAHPLDPLVRARRRPPRPWSRPRRGRRSPAPGRRSARACARAGGRSSRPRPRRARGGSRSASSCTRRACRARRRPRRACRRRRPASRSER